MIWTMVPIFLFEVHCVLALPKSVILNWNHAYMHLKDDYLDLQSRCHMLGTCLNAAFSSSKCDAALSFMTQFIDLINPETSACAYIWVIEREKLTRRPWIVLRAPMMVTGWQRGPGPKGTHYLTQMPTTIWLRNMGCRPVKWGGTVNAGVGCHRRGSQWGREKSGDGKAEMVVGGKERIDPQTESRSRSFNELRTIYLTALTGKVRKIAYKFIQRDHPKTSRWSSG